MRQIIFGITFFGGKPSFIDKQKMDGEKFGELQSTKIQEMRAMPSQQQQKCHKVRNENIQRYVSIKFRDFTPAFMKIR